MIHIGLVTSNPPVLLVNGDVELDGDCSHCRIGIVKQRVRNSHCLS